MRSTFIILLLGLITAKGTAQDKCLIEDRLTVTSTSLGSPLEGPYLPGEFVTFSYTILNYRTDPVLSGNQCQWLQGIIPVFGNAWSTESFFSNGRPRNRSRPSSNWRWFVEDSVSYNFNNNNLAIFSDDILNRKALCHSPTEDCSQATVISSTDLLPAGWFITTDDSRAPCEKAGEDPNDSWGIPQACRTNASHGSFTFTLQVRPYDDENQGCLQTGYTDASVSVYSFTDAEVGCFVGENSECADDAPAQWSAEVRCVPSGNANRYYNQSFPVCDIESWENLDFQLGSQPEYEGHEWPGCPSADNLLYPNWFTFVAQEDNIDFDILVEDCFDNAGIRYAVYEIPCDKVMGQGQGSANPFALGSPILGCSTAINSTQSSSNISFQATPGQLYGILVEGVDNDICNISFEINHVDELPVLSNLQAAEPTFDATVFGFDRDTVCLGAENVLFSSEELDGACGYQWRLQREDQGSSQFFRTDKPQLELNFPERDQFTICVRASNFCDTTSYSCIQFIVFPGANSFLTMDTICQGSAYTWLDEDGNVIREIPPQNDAGLSRFTEFLDNQTGCDITANLDLVVRRVNEDDPSVVDTFSCYENGQNTGLFFFCDTLTEPDTIDLQSCVSPITGCDTFFTIRYNILGGPISIESSCAGEGNIAFEFVDPGTDGNTRWEKQFELFSGNGNLEWNAEWTSSGGGEMQGKNTRWVVSQNELNAWSQNGNTTEISLTIQVLLQGEIYCISTASFLFSLSDNFPGIDSISGPDNYCLGDLDLSFSASYQNPNAPQHDRQSDTINKKLWTIPAGFSFQSPTNASSDTVRLLAPERERMDNPFVCFSVETNECQFVAEKCQPLQRQRVSVSIEPIDDCGQYVFGASLSDSLVVNGFKWSIENGEIFGEKNNPIVFAQSTGSDSAALRLEVESDCLGVGLEKLPPVSGEGIIRDLQDSPQSLYRRDCFGSSLYVITDPSCELKWGFVDTISGEYEFPIREESGNIWSEAYFEVPDSVSSSRIYFIERKVSCSEENCESELIQLRNQPILPCNEEIETILFPNPNFGNFKIRASHFPEGFYTGRLIPMDGRTALQKKMFIPSDTEFIKWTGNSIPAGQYLFELVGSENFRYTAKVIILSQ